MVKLIHLIFASLHRLWQLCLPFLFARDAFVSAQLSDDATSIIIRCRIKVDVMCMQGSRRIDSGVRGGPSRSVTAANGQATGENDYEELLWCVTWSAQSACLAATCYTKHQAGRPHVHLSCLNIIIDDDRTITRTMCCFYETRGNDKGLLYLDRCL
jgi:hypothetical protein